MGDLKNFRLNDLIKLGLNYLTTLDKFKVIINDYEDTNDVYKELFKSGLFKRVYVSNTFESTIESWEKKSGQEIKEERMRNDLNASIKELEKKFNVKLEIK